MKTPLEKIESIITAYNSKRWEPHEIERLVNASRSLATEIFFFSFEVGELHKQMTRTEFNRKLTFARSCQFLNDDKSKAGEKAVQTVIEREGLLMSQKALEEEKMSESEYQAAKLLLDSARDVLDAIRSQISYFKTEKTLEQSAQGSQR
jgi:hypothetical protein